MSIYAIGDLQGCYDALQRLLEIIHYEPQKDELWFVGDLVNRGNKSLQVLRFIKKLSNVKVVLGNHDIHLLALSSGKIHSQHTLHDILKAPDCDELIDWLKKLPLLHYHEKLNFVMVHAGIYPLWNLTQAQQYAKELEFVLQNYSLSEVTNNIYGNYPDVWHENLTGWDRLRFITNAFTRMRFCSLDGRLEFQSVEGTDKQPEGYLPWFNVPSKLDPQLNIVFGHWAALNGVSNHPNFFALDTGCVWGNSLTAMRLEDKQRFQINCHDK